MASEEISKQTYTSAAKTIIIRCIATLSSMFLVFGMYVIIFGLSIKILWHRRESHASKAYTRWIIALFVLTTIYNASAVWLYTEDTLYAFNGVKTNEIYIPRFESASGRNSRSKFSAQIGLFAFSGGIIGYIYDYLMVHRCYVIWGYSKRILYPFVIIVFLTDTINFVATASLTSAAYHHDKVLYQGYGHVLCVLAIINGVYTSLLTLLTAGRIWWMVREVGRITGSRIYTKYKIFVATILESGLLYSVITVVAAILRLIACIDPKSGGVAPFNFCVISVQMAAIAPTVIVVRIAYGQAVESVQHMVSTLQCAEGENNSQRCTIDLRRSLGEDEERGTAGRLSIGIEKSPSLGGTV
ncbi:hypothetical protein PM082_021117 [Marasmius tenuissimus]|nr:hypothetical protein PM082_021117 [Marasmius tenuissimus]